jgi:hypothetical protein
MKNILVLLLGLCASLSARAQLFSPESLTGALVGGVAGGIIGNNSGHQTAAGAAIGAGGGLLLGSLFHNARQDDYYSPYYSSAPAAYYPGPVYPAYYYYDRPNYAWSGAALGGIAGGIIGNNSGHHTLEGLAIGAGAGLVLGSVAEQAARRREFARAAAAQPYYVPPGYSANVAPAVTQTPAPPATNPTRLAAPASSMSSANSLFGR